MFGVLAAALLLFGAYLYMSYEKTLYCWDSANYSTLTGYSYQLFFPRNSPTASFRPIDGLWHVQKSFGAEYNLLCTVPLIFFQRVFGQSRTVFILAITFCYFIPYCIAWGLVATRLFTVSRRWVFWGMVVLSVLIPLSWMSVTYGYPDVGASALLGFAVYFYLLDVELKSLRQCIGIGLILFLLPLFRRHYVFGVTAFFAAAILQHLYLLIAQVRQDPRSLGGALLREIGRFCLLGGVLIGALYLLARPFVELIAGHNYFNLYQSYMFSPDKGLALFASAYGLILCAAAVCGYVLGFLVKVFHKPQGMFITILAIITIVQWLFVVQQPGIHYTTHFNPFIALGMLAVFAAASQVLRGGLKAVVFVLGSALLLYRFLIGFGVLAPFDSPDPAGALMAKNPPIVRRDYEELKRLIEDLRRDAPLNATIHAAASSFALNAEIVRNGEMEFYGVDKVRLRFPNTPDVDSRDWFPLEPLLKADYVITANPVQYCVRPDEQKIVRLVVDAFDQGVPITKDFTPFPSTYTLESGATVRVYRRNKPTEFSLALRELTRQEGMFPTRPGRQASWISLDHDHRIVIETDKSKPFKVVFASPDPNEPLEAAKRTERKRTIAYLDAPENGTMREVHSGNMYSGGPWMGQEVTLRTALADRKTGTRLAEGNPITVKPGGELSVPIPAAPAGVSRPYLLLEVTVPETVLPVKEIGSFTLEMLTVR